jgi:hypothetical protein
MAGRKRKWGWQGRRVTNFTRALSAALANRELDPGYVPPVAQEEAVQRLLFLESSIHPLAGSHAQEDAFCGTAKTIGVVPLLGGISFHDKDSRQNPAGFPDCPAIIGRTFYLIEMKAERDYPTEAQREWLTRMAGVTRVVTGVVKPSTWAAFVRTVTEYAEEDRLAALAESPDNHTTEVSDE